MFPRSLFRDEQNHFLIALQATSKMSSTSKNFNESPGTLPSHRIRTKAFSAPRDARSDRSSPRDASIPLAPTIVRSGETPAPPTVIEDDVEDSLPDTQDVEYEGDCCMDNYQSFAATCSACGVTAMIDSLNSSFLPDRVTCTCTTHHSKPATCAVTVLLNSSLGSKKRKQSARRE